MHSIRSIGSYFRSYLLEGVLWSNTLKNVSLLSDTRVEYPDEKVIQEFCQNDQEKAKILKRLMLEVEVMRLNGSPVPKTLTLHDWNMLSKEKCSIAKYKYLRLQCKCERIREEDQAKKLKEKNFEIVEFKEKYMKSLKAKSKECINEKRKLLNGSLFMPIGERHLDNFYNYRALQAMSHLQPTIIDCSYDGHMNIMENRGAAEQVSTLFGDNRRHNQPLNLHLCNINFNGEFMYHLQMSMPTIHKPWFPLCVHKESYLNLFPKDKLIYITPDAKETLKKFEHNAIYIVACMVQKGNSKPISIAKVQKEGIRVAKLPLNRYLNFVANSRTSLTINQVIAILADIRWTGDWKYALRHVPRRHLWQTKLLMRQKQLAYSQLYKENIIHPRIRDQTQEPARTGLDHSRNSAIGYI